MATRAAAVARSLLARSSRLPGGSQVAARSQARPFATSSQNGREPKEIGVTSGAFVLVMGLGVLFLYVDSGNSFYMMFPVLKRKGKPDPQP